MVVDDQADARESLCMVLELSGYAVKVAATAEGALKVIEEFNPLGVLLDLGLPDKTSGLRLAEQVRARYGSMLVVIAVTGYAGSDNADVAMASGLDHVLAKPIDYERLNRILPPLR